LGQSRILSSQYTRAAIPGLAGGMAGAPHWSRSDPHCISCWGAGVQAEFQEYSADGNVV
jgi:hypothetical protein